MVLQHSLLKETAFAKKLYKLAWLESIWVHGIAVAVIVSKHTVNDFLLLVWQSCKYLRSTYFFAEELRPLCWAPTRRRSCLLDQAGRFSIYSAFLLTFIFCFVEFLGVFIEIWARILRNLKLVSIDIRKLLIRIVFKFIYLLLVKNSVFGRLNLFDDLSCG